MTEVYVGQVMMTGFGFAPKGFAQCNGQTMSIQQNQALFALIGVSYGGNGSTNFVLPDLRGRVPAGANSSVDPTWQPAPYVNGQPGGNETITLLSANLPQHNHSFAASTSLGATKIPTAGTDYLAQTGTEQAWAPYGGAMVTLAIPTLTPYGNNQPHANMQPFRVINFNIALNGIYPSRN